MLPWLAPREKFLKLRSTNRWKIYFGRSSWLQTHSLHIACLQRQKFFLELQFQKKFYDINLFLLKCSYFPFSGNTSDSRKLWLKEIGLISIFWNKQNNSKMPGYHHHFQMMKMITMRIKCLKVCVTHKRVVVLFPVTKSARRSHNLRLLHTKSWVRCRIEPAFNEYSDKNRATC